jgi:hypothetical protein
MEASKTPQFDALLDEILENLTPHTRICTQKDISHYCEGEFSIEAEDIVFYKMLRVPPPLCCPTCRRQKRFAFVNRMSFYKRKNDAPEGPAYVVSYVPPNAPFVVYDYEYYRSDKWNPLTYARDYDTADSFFNQLYGLRRDVPQPALLKDPSNINYEYSLNGRDSKNVYCSSGIFYSEDVWYSVFITKGRGIMDSHKAPHNEECYKVSFTEHSNNCHFGHFLKQCINCSFMYDCRNCQDCFGCVNLRNKRYCFFNEELSKEAYEEKIKSLKLDKRSSLREIEEKFWNLVKTQPVLGSRSTRAIDCDGVIIVNSRNCKYCVSIEKALNERYCDSTITHRDSMDIYASGSSELLYECSGSGSDCAQCKFLVISKFITHSEYMINCRLCQFCFGCIGLENKKYCIFNKQYEPEEYFQELDRIKTTLLEKGEYGEFFPYAFSAFAYNESDVDLVYPLTKEEIEQLGGLYQEDVETDTTGIEVLHADDLPDSIFDVTDDILTKAIMCEETTKPFRIIASELEFYRKHKLPLPTVHPYKRVKNMFKNMGNNLVYQSLCESCGKSIKTIYKPEGGESSLSWRTYCEDCFGKEVA